MLFFLITNFERNVVRHLFSKMYHFTGQQLCLMQYALNFGQST